ncbi:recombination repair protein 1-like [Halichondria panicea]|uniref:recombination repair protein 1-like n=1 Tax=Halichondria panicea TaxID=6063 RepID=UPI00312B4AA1
MGSWFPARGQRRLSEISRNPSHAKRERGKENKTNWDGIKWNELGQTKDWRLWTNKFSSWNVNGIRAWIKNGGLEYIAREDPDIFCVQETKCIEKELPMNQLGIPGYHVYWHSAEKKGYSDLKNPKTNAKTAGFTPEERQDFTELLEEGFVDTFRHLYPDLAGAYTYWSYRFNARAKNTGWRLDYFVVSERLLPHVTDS